jgi:hypothetical protein
MSVVQRVIPLNKPFKIRGYTILQWVILAVSVALAFIIGANIPKDWKLGNLPLGFLVGLGIFCGAIVFVSASQMKPFAWWRNVILDRLGISPRVYIPHREPGYEYPDSTIIEPTKREDQAYYESED